MLRTARNTRHRDHGLHRIFPCCRFAGKHDRARAVIDGVCHVRRFRTGRPWIVHHAVQHLRRGNDKFTRAVCLMDQAFLQDRNLLERYFHAHIPARHHNTVRHTQDIVNILDAFRVFYFCNDFDAPAMVTVQYFLNVEDVLFITGKACRNKIHLVFNAKDNICLVLFADIRQGH